MLKKIQMKEIEAVFISVTTVEWGLANYKELKIYTGCSERHEFLNSNYKQIKYKCFLCLLLST